LVDAFAEAKDAEWAYYALRNIRDLAEAQRTKLCETIVAAKYAYWAHYALRDIGGLTEAQRSTLHKIARAA
jgi:hypothetical protein